MKKRGYQELVSYGSQLKLLQTSPMLLSAEQCPTLELPIMASLL